MVQVGLDLCYEKLLFIFHIEKIALFLIYEIQKIVFHSLDLNPSVLMRLEKQAKKIPTWPTEINFSIHKKSIGKRREMFTEYKEQLTRWER
jgi:hypothetical protein